MVTWNSPRVDKDTAYDKHDFLKALEPGGYLGDWINETCDIVVQTARLVRGNETAFMEKMVGRT